MRLFWYYFTPILFFVSGYLFGRKKKRRMLKPPREIMLEPRTISGDQLEDAGVSSSPTSPDRSDSGGQYEDAGVSSSLTSPERSDSGPSTPSTSEMGSDYYIFLSFRGPDTRNGFIDHLYHGLNDVGLSFHPNFMLKDENDLPFSEATAANLISAITHSKVLIPVISPNYASSEWCLRELIHIMKRNEGGGHIVLPVLYKVEPKDVQHLQGSFGEAFRSHEHHFDEEVKQQGKEALTKAADSRVFESEKFANGCEAELVKELIELVMSKQQEIFRPSLPMNLVGIDDHVAEVMRLVDPAYPETRTIGIYGIDGIGKTTLATIIYDKLSYKFEHYSFLEDIKETVRQRGIKHVRSQLISDILKFNDHQMCDSHIISSSILSSFKEKKVLIVLDDVDQKDHLDYLIGDCRFMPGSRIIVTCQDKAILESKYRYELKEMNCEDSLLLFSRHAFEGNTPPKELGTLSSDIVATTGGHPLALTVIGALHNSIANQRVPRDILKQLKDAHNTTIQQKLRISYDSLEYEEQQMFLDIACFFHGTDQRIATYLWDDLNFFPISGLAKMTERSLIKFDADNELKMHDRLKYLGRDITRQANEKPWCRSRLWDEEAMTVLECKDENKNIEALRLDNNGSSEFVKQESFKRMPNMKFLHISAVDLAGDFKESLSELRWLKWERCPNSFEATNFHLEKLLILDLSGGNISENWGGWSATKMERLKVINLSWCSNLKSTPNLSTFKSLEMLLLNNCENLEEIDPSIGDAKYLTSLNLSYCGKLKKLPSQLGELKRLVSLKLSSCWTLKELPKEMGKLEELKELNACSCMSLVGLPDSISHLVNLLTLDLRWCSHFKELPESIGSLVKLQSLLLGNMALPSEDDDSGYDWDSHDIYLFDHIPHSIGKLKSLTELHLTCAKILELPTSIGDLKILKILKIAGCKELSSLPSTLSKLGKLEELDATACTSLEGAIPINGLSSLKILQLGKLCHTVGLYDMLEMDNPLLEMFSDLSSQRHPYLINCDVPANLTILEVTCQNHELPQLSHLIHLKELSFQFCEFLESIPVLPSGILNLWVVLCGKLEKLPSLSSLESLLELHIIGCGELMEIKGLEGLKSLGRLSLHECKKLPNLNGLEHLESLRRLEIEDLDASLMNDHQFQVQCLGGLKNLERLCITRCESLTRLDVSQLTNLRELVVFECEDVDKIKGLEGLKKLTYLNIRGCNSIGKLPDLSLFDNLGQLDIEGCSNLQDV